MIDLRTLSNTLSSLIFKDYDEMQELICLPDGSVEKDPLSGKVKENKITQEHTNNSFKQNKVRIDYLDSFLFCFFSRFNTKYQMDKFHMEYHDFKKVFLDELRNGAMRNWKVSTNKRDKGILLRNIENKKIDKYTLQWIADFYDILLIIDDREYIPRKVKENKPIMKLQYNDDGYKLF